MDEMKSGLILVNSETGHSEDQQPNLRHAVNGLAKVVPKSQDVNSHRHTVNGLAPDFSHTDTNTRISQMKLKPSFFLHCVTNRGLPFPTHVVDGQIQGHQPAVDAQSWLFERSS